ncbi:MAG: dihydroneopterin aldolase [Pseudomonadota bacterium]
MTLQDKLILCLEDVIIHTSIGIYDYEKHPDHPNELKISVELHAGVAPGPLDRQPMIDYAKIYAFLRAIPAGGHIDLLETLADRIIAQCFTMERVTACRVKVLKTKLLPDCGGAGIDVFRTRENWLKVSS